MAAPDAPDLEPVEIHPYDPTWPSQYEALAERACSALGGVALGIHHIGSTSVPGLAAKPLVDVIVLVASFEPIRAYAEPLSAMGFIYRADDEPRHRFFKNDPRTAQIHVVDPTSDWVRVHVLFRDYLRVHPDAARAYEDLKGALAVRFRNNRKAYTDAKGPFIDATIQDAEAWAERTGWVVRT